MSQGEGGGRPRKHPHAPKIGQVAIDAEWQEIADSNSEALELRARYGSYDAITAIVDTAGTDNARFAAAILAQNEIAKHADKNDINTLYECLEEYIRFCIEHNVRITNSGAYAACGLSRFVVKDWAHGLKRKSDPRYQEFALYIKSVCDQYREMLMAENKVNPVVGIWWQKNYDGFRDNPNESDDFQEDSNNLTAAEIAAKYEMVDD